MKITSKIVGEWIKNMPKYRSMSAWSYLHLKVTPEIFRTKKLTDEEREQLEQSLANLEIQFSLFEQALSELPDPVRDAMVAQYLKRRGEEDKPDPKLLNEGRKEVSRVLKEMRAAGEIRMQVMRTGQPAFFRTEIGTALVEQPKIERRIQTIASLWRPVNKEESVAS